MKVNIEGDQLEPMLEQQQEFKPGFLLFNNNGNTARPGVLSSFLFMPSFTEEQAVSVTL